MRYLFLTRHFLQNLQDHFKLYGRIMNNELKDFLKNEKRNPSVFYATHIKNIAISFPKD